jgi:NhaP-type Na+/H+ or K+/H+ antiporter
VDALSTQIVVPVAVGTGGFNDAAFVFGALLVLGALISGLARRSFLSLAAVFVLAGFALGDGGLDVLDFSPRSGFVQDLTIVALIVILFRDGLEVDAEMLQREWRLPFRKLALAMPLTAALVALITHVVTDMGWTECFLLGALLSPTDPVLSSNVVTNSRIPRGVRHSLNLESGLNDGLALPAVLAFAAALSTEQNDFVWWKFFLQDVSVGFIFGVATGWVASRLMPRSHGLARSIPDHQKSLYALGVAFVAYASAVTEPHGNGFISVFVCAITLGILRPDLRENFEHRAADIVEIVKLAVFVVFGSLLTFDSLFNDGWAAVAIVAFTLLLARPIAICVSLVRTETDLVTRGFMAWFGPKGVATMAFSLLVLGESVPAGERLFGIAALAVFASIIVHGLSDTPGSNWFARRAERLGLEDVGRPRAAVVDPAAAGG